MLPQLNKLEKWKNRTDVPIILESGRFDSVHPAPYFIADISFGL